MMRKKNKFELVTLYAAVCFIGGSVGYTIAKIVAWVFDLLF